MSLKEHYSFNSRKSLKPYLKLIVMLSMFTTISHTFCSYKYTTINNGILSIAKWYIEINGEEIKNGTSALGKNINLLNVEDNTTNIDSGDECYFDLTINPKSTEVSIYYTIKLDLEESNLPNGTKILKYEKYTNTGENEQLEKTENINAKSVSIVENIALPEMQIALDNTSIRRYRIYCKIPFPADIKKGDNFTVTPKITIEQYIRYLE